MQNLSKTCPFLNLIALWLNIWKVNTMVSVLLGVGRCCRCLLAGPRGLHPSWATRILWALLFPALLLLLSVTDFGLPCTCCNTNRNKSSGQVSELIAVKNGRCETQECCLKLRSRWWISLTVAWDVPSSGSFQSSVTTCWTGFTSALLFFLLFLTWAGAGTSCTCVHTENKRSHCCKQWEGLQRHLPLRLYTCGLYLLSFDLLGELGVHLSQLNFFLSHRHWLSVGLGALRERDRLKKTQKSLCLSEF